MPEETVQPQIIPLEPPVVVPPTDDTLVVVPSTTPQPASTTELTLEEIERGAQAIQPEAKIIVAPESVENTKVVHTYEDDMAQAMDVTDAKVVQELMFTARERETIEETQKHNKKAKKWYTAFSILFILIAFAALSYGTYHYNSLTIPATNTISVGVFPTTDSFVASSSTLETFFAQLQDSKTLIKNKPYLATLVTDTATQNLLTNNALFSFIGAQFTEPFITSLSAVRVGVFDKGNEVVPFIIASAIDQDITIKEFLIAEPTMVKEFARALSLTDTEITPEATNTFVSEYRYNLPVRTLYTTTPSGEKVLTILYGFITKNIVLITTDPLILKTAYDTVLRQ